LFTSPGWSCSPSYFEKDGLESRLISEIFLEIERSSKGNTMISGVTGNISTPIHQRSFSPFLGNLPNTPWKFISVPAVNDNVFACMIVINP